MTPSMRRPKLRRPRRPEGRNPRPARPFAPPGPRRPRICGKRNFPLDFARRIRYNNIHDKPVRRDAEGVARDLLRQMHRALQCFGGPAPAVSRRQGAGPQPGYSHRPMWRNGRRKRLKIVRETMWVRVPPSAPNQYNPNLFPIGDGFGLFVFFDRYESTYFRNGVERKPTSKPREPRKKKKSI